MSEYTKEALAKLARQVFDISGAATLTVQITDSIDYHVDRQGEYLIDNRNPEGDRSVVLPPHIIAVIMRHLEKRKMELILAGN